jgi:fatty acid desaturase
LESYVQAISSHLTRPRSKRRCNLDPTKIIMTILEYCAPAFIFVVRSTGGYPVSSRQQNKSLVGNTEDQRQRLPIGMMRNGCEPWLSTRGTNVAIAVAVAMLIWFIGFKPFLLMQLPMTLLAGSIGVWLFYVQHQFEGTFWAHDDEWTLHEAALCGSSYYDLPAILCWLTANIGVHHIHHLCSRIPHYYLPLALRDNPEPRSVSRLTLRESFRCVRFALWDERQRRLVSFREMRLLSHQCSNQSPSRRDCGSISLDPETQSPSCCTP